MKNRIAFRHLKAVVAEPSTAHNTQLATTLAASMMSLGFVPTENLFDTLKTMQSADLETIYNSLIPILRESIGADVSYCPMYPNFPAEVLDASYLDLFINAIIHYWTYGQWKPAIAKLPRDFHFEHTEFTKIDVASEEDFNAIFTTLLSSNESLSQDAKESVEWFLVNTDLDIPSEIPYKETMCLVAGHFMNTGKSISGAVKTATDVLRVATYLSGGDVSLAENTKFKSFPRAQRRMIISALENVVKEEDIARHRNKWVKLFHSLHVGEYSDKLFSIAKKVRENQRIETFNSKVEAAILNKDIQTVVDLLKTRPGEFARRIDHLLRISRKAPYIIESFLSVADGVSTRVLLQLLGNLKTRNQDVENRYVFPKAMAQRAIVVNKSLKKLSGRSIKSLQSGIEKILQARFGTLDSLGNVYINPELANCPIPMQQRSTSSGAFSIARGTKLPIADDKNTLRFFVYWVGQDIDLSATLHDDQFNKVSHISYTALKSDQIQACHSGDIVNAPYGASEFIDITIDKAVEAGIRYVAMNVLVYAGPTFAEHEKVYAGWMTRNNPNSNEIYEPKTVEQKVNLTSKTTNCIPVVFDLVERKAIWVDLTTSQRNHWGGNNVESNRATIEQSIMAILEAKNKTTLQELFTLHAKARGRIVSDPQESDTVFDLKDAYKVDNINAEFLA